MVFSLNIMYLCKRVCSPVILNLIVQQTLAHFTHYILQVFNVEFDYFPFTSFKNKTVCFYCSVDANLTS